CEFRTLPDSRRRQIDPRKENRLCRGPCDIPNIAPRQKKGAPLFADRRKSSPCFPSPAACADIRAELKVWRYPENRTQASRRQDCHRAKLAECRDRSSARPPRGWRCQVRARLRVRLTHGSLRRSIQRSAGQGPRVNPWKRLAFGVAFLVG